MKDRRQDKARVVLKKGESQRANGSYDYRWTTPDGKRHSVYARTLDELREKEKAIALDLLEGIDSSSMYLTVNELYDMWCNLKRGIKDNTMQNYRYMFDTYVKETKFGKARIAKLKKSDVKAFYIYLKEDRCLKSSTIDGIHNILHQVFDVAVDDNYIRNNPTDNVLKEFKKAYGSDIEKRKALTIDEERLFLNFIKNNPQYRHWYPIFQVMLGTGMRVGEVVGLRWCDVDLENGLVDVNHTLVYFSRGNDNGCYFKVNTPKTKAGRRVIVMQDVVKEAFEIEKVYQNSIGLECVVSIDGYTDFIFVNRFGATQHNGTLNKAIRRIIRDCNSEMLDKDPDTTLLLPPFSCHSLRHTFTTRMCEAGLNVKFIQETLGHADISTTLNIYADCTSKLKEDSLKQLKDFYATM